MITAEQRQLRRQYIGASDAPAIFGVDPFRTAGDLFMEKTGRYERAGSSAAMDRGNLLEPAVLAWAVEELGVELQPDQFVSHAEWPRLCANLDARVTGERAGVEAKTTTGDDEWGEKYTDQVPERVIIQTHQQMLLAELDRVYVPVLMPVFRRFEFRMYVVERDDVLAQAIGERASEWYETYVVANVRPPREPVSLEVLRKIRREVGLVAPVDAATVGEWLAAKEIAKAAKERVETAEAALLTQFGDADVGEYPGGVITYNETNRKGYTVEPCTYRTLRHKAAKGS